ncbi:MAG: glycosyltransferase [Cytophagales bacterium]|nr:glycosyltransferase [Cytophagales bacterium]
MKPLISVIMPVRNAAGTVKRALNSIIDQTFPHFELIVVNDGSVDNTTSLLNSYHDPRLTVIHQEHKGIAKSLNKAIRLAKSPLIARMDADDIASPQRLQLQHEYMQKHPGTGVVSCLVNFQGDVQRQKGYFLYCQWINRLISCHEIYINRFADAPLAHPTVLFRKAVVDRYGYYDESELPEDYELWLRWMEKGVRFSKVREELLTWTDSPNRLSRVHPNYSQEAFYKVKTKYLVNWICRKFPAKLPEIWIWGWGKAVFQKSSYLPYHGLPITGYIDLSVNPARQKKRRVIHYSAIPGPENTLILSYVGDRVGKTKIYQYLVSRGYVAGVSFYMMA